jgi:hypothetical protein
VVSCTSDRDEGLAELYDRVKTRSIASEITSPFNFDPEIDCAIGHTLLRLWDSAKDEEEAAEIEENLGIYAESCSRQLLYLIFNSFERTSSELYSERSKLNEALRENAQLEEQFSAVRDRFRRSYLYIKNLWINEKEGMDSLFQPFSEMEARKLEIEKRANELRDCVPSEIPLKEKRLIGYLKHLQRELKLSNRTMFELCRNIFENILDQSRMRKQLQRSNFAPAS